MRAAAAIVRLSEWLTPLRFWTAMCYPVKSNELAAEFRRLRGAPSRNNDVSP